MFCSGTLFAQPAEKLIKVIVAPNHADWVYKTGEKITFDVTVTKNSIPLKSVEVRYEIAEDMMDPLQMETKTLDKGTFTIQAGSMDKPGFLRCRVWAKYAGKEYPGLATAAVSPELIRPTVKLPADFTEFWDNAKKEAATIAMDTRMTLIPERCTEKVEVYHVSIQNYQPGTRLYGIVCIPKGGGKHPAVLKVPGAGIRPYYGDVANAERGYITFEIGIHGIPVNLPVGVYDDLRNGALRGYNNFNLENRDQYYYKRVYLGCVRAVDFIYSLPQFDGNNLVVQGGSQGGALSIVAAGLDSRIKGLTAFYPALCDLTGYLHGRAGGWPHMFKDPTNNTPTKIETASYYDVVNFARQIKVPGFYSYGYNDMVCPPTSMSSAFNVIAAPKDFEVVEEIGHYAYPEQWEKAWQWIDKLIKK
ncbi:MAG: acetylxylan esterase [Massilibacteroides sp.]|nr:acetylxylan esterase [Massilibacteroides sp.]MDD3063724.1 acetylxylan esterase [Massilibacteroides sp.]MDD4115049.1 acetylxylan esterase [Massilibacteroides sp.]MDD4659669.1 acetylxylan esterase [Massilibacteroides sp.]